MNAPADTSDPVFALSHELVEAVAARRPVDATMAGIPADHGAWTDYSPAGAAAWAEVLESFRARLLALPAAPGGEAGRWARLARRVMDEDLAGRLDDLAHGEHLLDLNHIDSTFQHIRMVFDVMDTGTAGGWESIAARLSTIDRAAEGYRLALEEGRRTGRTVARRQVLAAIDQARRNAGDASFFLTLPPACERSGAGAPAATRARIAAGAERARRAFAELGDYLARDYLPHAREADAVGRDRYLRLARRFLGATIDPVEIYAWGWSEVHALESRMARVAQEILPGASLPEVIELLKSDPARCAADAHELLRVVEERQQRALSELDGAHFDIPAPLRRIDVKLAPPGGPIGAYYTTPSEGFERPGTIWYSVGDARAFPLWDEITTAYHEGFPGHHLQCGLQVHLDDRLSRLHRSLVCWAGHAEGWALYAEELMFELGYFERPDYVLGMLAAKLTRAYRVVLDIGMHLELPIPPDAPLHPGEAWTHEIAVEYLRRRAFLEPEHAWSEATRYLGWPGQAICYKVGERAILDLRDELRRREGPAFDRKAFHAAVIGSGSVGLTHLRELVIPHALAS